MQSTDLRYLHPLRQQAIRDYVIRGTLGATMQGMSVHVQPKNKGDICRTSYAKEKNGPRAGVSR
jgi:hypothetical protein